MCVCVCNSTYSQYRVLPVFCLVFNVSLLYLFVYLFIYCLHCRSYLFALIKNFCFLSNLSRVYPAFRPSDRYDKLQHHTPRPRRISSLEKVCVLPKVLIFYDKRMTYKPDELLCSLPLKIHQKESKYFKC